MKSRKNITNGLTIVLVAIGMLGITAGTANAQATIIYADSFTRSGALHGSAPDTAPGAEMWTADAGWSNNGTQAALSTITAQAYLPFTPSAGKVYTVKATIDTTTGNAGWFLGVGFSPSTVSDAWPGNSVGPLMIESLSPGWKAYLTLGTGGSPMATGGTDAGAVEYAVELDTQPALWTVKYYMNGTEVASGAYTSNPTINYVTFANWHAVNGTPGDDTVDDFELKEGDYASVPAGPATPGTLIYGK